MNNREDRIVIEGNDGITRVFMLPLPEQFRPVYESSSTIDWEELRANIPTRRKPTEREKRLGLYFRNANEL
jgi:hypothetical protein